MEKHRNDVRPETAFNVCGNFGKRLLINRTIVQRMPKRASANNSAKFASSKLLFFLDRSYLGQGRVSRVKEYKKEKFYFSGIADLVIP